MTPYIITQIADADKNNPVEMQKARELAYRLGVLRKDLWNQFGGIQAWGRKPHELLSEFKVTHPPEHYQLDFKNWDKTASQVLDDIQMTHAAIREKVIRKIVARYPDKATRTALCNALKTLEYQKNNVLHRWVRSAFGRGHTQVDNHIFHEDGIIRLHYPVKKQASRNTCPEKLGVDKGYSEALYGSDGVVYGAGIGKIIALQSDWLKTKMQNRNKLHALYKKTGNEAIKRHNLGRKTLDKRVKATKTQLKSIIRHGVKHIFSQFGTVVCEDLSARFKHKSLGKNTNRKLSAWCKGEIHQALTEMAERTNSILKIVNPAYTSQVDHLTGTLLGTRQGDRFIRYTGEVLQADYNAALNILARDNDPDITRFTPYQKVKEILLKRTACFIEQMKFGGGEPIEGLA